MSRREFLLHHGGRRRCGADDRRRRDRHRSGSAGAGSRDCAGAPVLIKGGCVLSLDRAVGDFEGSRRSDRGQRDSGSAAEHQRTQCRGDRRLEVDRDAGVRRHPPAHVAGLPAQRAAGRFARRLSQRRAATFGAKMMPDDVYAANLLSALGAIDSGVTCVLDWSHIQNTPEHTDACIKGCRTPGVRAVFAYGAGQNETGRVWEIANQQVPRRHRAPAQAVFLQRRSAGDTLPGGPRITPKSIASSFKSARDVGARISIHVGVGEFGRSALLEKLHALQGAQGRHHLHPLLHAQRHRMEADQGYRRDDFDRRLCRDADGARQPADPEGDRPGHPARR